MSSLQERLDRQAAIEPRVRKLMAAFDGAIKYTPMLHDHGEGTSDAWTDKQCVAFAKKWHAEAIIGLRTALVAERMGLGPWAEQSPRWNNGVPYCRNQPTAEMLKEARK